MDYLRHWFERSRYGSTVRLLLMFVGFPLLLWLIGRLIYWIFGVQFSGGADGYY